MGLGDFLAAEGRTGALVNATDKLSNLALKLRDRKVADERYQEGAKLRSLQTEEASLGVRNLKNKVAAQEQEINRRNKRIPLDVFQGAFEYPEQFEWAKKVAASQGAINIEDPEAPYITVGDSERLKGMLSDEGNSLKFAQLGYGAAKKQKAQIVQALQQTKPDSKEYQALQQQLVAVNGKVSDYGAMKDSLLKITTEKNTNEEKNIAALTEAFGGGPDANAKATDMVFNRRGKSDEEFLRSVYTTALSSTFGEGAQEAEAATRKAARTFNIDYDKVFGGSKQVDNTATQETPSILSPERNYGFNRGPSDIPDIKSARSNPLDMTPEEVNSLNVATPSKQVTPKRAGGGPVASKHKGKSTVRSERKFGGVTGRTRKSLSVTREHIRALKAGIKRSKSRKETAIVRKLSIELIKESKKLKKLLGK